jgi:hypothetical protein
MARARAIKCWSVFGAVTDSQVYTWSHELHVESCGQLGTIAQHSAFRGRDGAQLDSASRIGPFITSEIRKALEEAGMPTATLTCNDLRHM